jgi:hypothetical protein
MGGLLDLVAKPMAWLADKALFLALAVAASSLLIMREASGLLGSLQASGSQSYNMGTFNGARLTFWDIRPLRLALRRWSADPEVHHAAQMWMRWQIFFDLFFTLAYTVLLLWLLRRILPHKVALAGRLAALVFLCDEIENVLTFWVSHWVAKGGDAPSWLLHATAIATAAKWAAIFAALLVAAVLGLQRKVNVLAGEGTPIGNRATLAAANVVKSQQTLGRARVFSRLRVQIVILALLAIFLVLPGGGALEQLTDVLRSIFDGSDWWRTLLPSVGALAALVASLYLSGRWALLADKSPGAKRDAAHGPWPFLVLGGLGLIVAVAAYSFARVPWATAGMFAVPIVLLSIGVLDWVLGAKTGKQNGWPDTFAKDDPVRKIDVPNGDGKVALEQAIRVIAAVPVVLASLALVRAFAAPALVWNGHDRLWPAVLVGLGFVGSIFGGAAVVKTLRWLEKNTEGPQPNDIYNVASVVVTFLVLLATMLLAIDPIRYSKVWQLSGVFVLFLAACTLVLGWFRQRTERRLPLIASWKLRLGRRSPIFLVLLLTFLLAGRLDTTGGYHDVRLTGPDQAVDSHGGDSLSSWWTSWTQQMSVAKGCRGQAAGRPAVPLMLVAAPGGGIRAAYWTATALDALTAKGQGSPTASHDCLRRSLFAVSGVSGGSVGIATWLAHPDGKSATAAVTRLADPVPLAADGAAMLLRDLPRSISGVNVPWGDRAAVFERAWEKADPALANTFRESTRPDSPWRPIVLLNSTATESGCRILVTQLDASVLPAPGHACTSPSLTSNREQFADGSEDSRDFTVGRSSLSGRQCTTDARARELHMSTAAHLSARFAFVSPSGGLIGCTPDATKDAAEGTEIDRNPYTTYAIDGGYLENTGLQSLLQLFDAVQPDIQRWNSNQRSEFTIVPVLVVADNHYTSDKPALAAPRRPELLVPLQGRGAKSTAMDAAIWEQHAFARFAGPPPGMDKASCASSDPTTCKRVGEMCASPADSTLCRRAFLVSPDVRPQVAAPLGWALSEGSRTNLSEQLACQFAEHADPAKHCPSGARHRGWEVRTLLTSLLASTN